MTISDKVVNGIRLGDIPPEPIKGINELCIEANAEGAVLLKNDGFLPLNKNEKVAVFGRIQMDYYKSGTGSGGLVKVPYKTNIYDSLVNSGYVKVDEELGQTYKNWIKDNPFDFGTGWMQLDSPKEMPLSDGFLASVSERNDKAIYIIGRTAGECNDNTANEGSYNLAQIEYENLKKICNAFDDVCVLLNTGNIIDMKWAKELPIKAIMYVWQGGQDGGEAVAQILCGKLTPSGKLSDTVVENITDYPSYENFLNKDENIYAEDIYVGYRYFETFEKDKVVYPFGFGLSYTEFETRIISATETNGVITLEAYVKNTGKYAGKETLQVYFEGIGEKLSRPARELISFAKTNTLLPGESEKISLSFKISDMAAYDDSGVTGNKSCYVLEKGVLNIYFGTDVRNAQKVFEYTVNETQVTKKLTERFAPCVSFDRIVNKNGQIAYETVVGKKKEIVFPDVPEQIYTGDKGIKLSDVYYNKSTIDDFIAQLSDFDLACISQGEGMNSAKVRPGTGGTFGGVTTSLMNFGIPPIAVTDGPSGLRFDNGDHATSLPNGTLMACTWNESLTEELYTYEGMEGYAHKIDALLGPGTNIHRIPLCGRNFEYLSEDPYLSGAIARKMCKGLKNGGITGTIKHFAANNKEENRNLINMVISERALREIYLKPFEMVITEGSASMVMTAYNQINSVFCPSNPELNTSILRDEWGYNGLVMTDWWPKTSFDDSGNPLVNRDLPIKAQNDLYMVNLDAEKTANDIMTFVNDGTLSRGELARNAKNILNVILKTPTFERYLNGETIGTKEIKDVSGMELCLSCDDIDNEKTISLETDKPNEFALKISYSSEKSEIMQIPVKVNINGNNAGVFMVRGTGGEISDSIMSIYLLNGESIFSFEYVADDVKIEKIELYK